MKARCMHEMDGHACKPHKNVRQFCMKVGGLHERVSLACKPLKNVRGSLVSAEDHAWICDSAHQDGADFARPFTKGGLVISRKAIGYTEASLFGLQIFERASVNFCDGCMLARGS